MKEQRSVYNTSGNKCKDLWNKQPTPSQKHTCKRETGNWKSSWRLLGNREDDSKKKEEEQQTRSRRTNSNNHNSHKSKQWDALRTKEENEKNIRTEKLKTEIKLRKMPEKKETEPPKQNREH